MDDGTFLLHRLRVGGSGHWENRKLYFSVAGFTRSLSNCGPARVLAAPRDRTRVDWVADCVELSRHQLERDLSELDHVWHACAVCCLRGFRSEPRVGCKFTSAFHSQRFCFRVAGPADCSLLHDRLRIGSEGGGGAQPGIQRTWLLHSNLDGNCCGDSLLHDRNCSGGIRRSLEKIDG